MELPTGFLGCVDHAKKIIWLDSRLTQAERRSTLAHEIGHLERGAAPCDPELASYEERAIDEWASRLLIPTYMLVRAFQWSADLAEIAEELWVDMHMLRARMRGMTDAEQDAVMEAIRRLYTAA